jgi:hypothetical protein
MQQRIGIPNPDRPRTVSKSKRTPLNDSSKTPLLDSQRPSEQITCFRASIMVKGRDLCLYIAGRVHLQC